MHNHHASWIAKTRDNHYHSTTQLLNHTSPHDHPIVKPPYFAYAGSEFWHEKWPKPLCEAEICLCSSSREISKSKKSAELTTPLSDSARPVHTCSMAETDRDQAAECGKRTQKWAQQQPAAAGGKSGQKPGPESLLRTEAAEKQQKRRRRAKKEDKRRLEEREGE